MREVVNRDWEAAKYLVKVNPSRWVMGYSSKGITLFERWAEFWMPVETLISIPKEDESV